MCPFPDVPEEGNFVKVKSLSPDKIGLKSFFHFRTVLGEGNFGKVRPFSPGKIELKSFVHFQTSRGRATLAR
jgi:hypothetical protein